MVLRASSSSVRVRIDVLLLLFSFFFDQLEVEFMEFSDEVCIPAHLKNRSLWIGGEFCNTSVDSGDLGRRDIHAI